MPVTAEEADGGIGAGAGASTLIIFADAISLGTHDRKYNRESLGTSTVIAGILPELS